MLSLERLHLTASRAQWQELVGTLTVAGWLLLAILIASSYIGHSSSPYGTCAAPGGHTVSCRLLHR